MRVMLFCASLPQVTGENPPALLTPPRTWIVDPATGIVSGTVAVFSLNVTLRTFLPVYCTIAAAPPRKPSVEDRKLRFFRSVPGTTNGVQVLPVSFET